MLMGVSGYAEIAFAEHPDPNRFRQGAIVAQLHTAAKYSAPVEVKTKIEATMNTQPGR